MVVRFFSAIGWITVMFSFAVFMIAYANFPDEVLVNVNKLGEPLHYLSKSSLFYILIAFLVLFNASLVGLKGILKNQSAYSDWSQTGLHITQIFFNLFFASSVYFFNIINSRENFNYSNFGYLIFVTGILLVISVVFTLVARLVIKK